MVVSDRLHENAGCAEKLLVLSLKSAHAADVYQRARRLNSRDTPGVSRSVVMKLTATRRSPSTAAMLSSARKICATQFGGSNWLTVTPRVTPSLAVRRSYSNYAEILGKSKTEGWPSGRCRWS